MATIGTFNTQLSTEGDVNSGEDRYRDAKRGGMYLALFTDSEGNSFFYFSFYQIS